jgi:hypothetical protein
MSISLGILQIEIFLLVITTAVSWFHRDDNNYTHVICTLFAVIFSFTTALSFSSGIDNEQVTHTYLIGWMAWVFVGLGIVTAIIGIVKTLDTLTENKKHGSVNMDLDMRL